MGGVGWGGVGWDDVAGAKLSTEKGEGGVPQCQGGAQAACQVRSLPPFHA